MSVGTTKKKSTSEAEAAAPDEGAAAKPDLEVILPTDGVVDVDGQKVRIRRIKSREFFALMRIITKGLGEGIGRVRFDINSDDPEQMSADLVAILALAVPEAIEEVGMFLRAICEPVDQKATAQVALALENPEVDVMLDVLGVMIEQEKDDLQPLLGKARAWIVRLQRTMQERPTG